MLHEHPVPWVATITQDKLFDITTLAAELQDQVIPLPARTAMPPLAEKVQAVETLRTTSREPVIALEAPVVTEPLIAPAQTHPWWLTTPELPPAAVAETTPEPTDADRAAALLSSLWMGGLVLELSAPDPEVKEAQPQPPQDESDNDEE